MRILVTGSRDWPSEGMVRDAILGVIGGSLADDITIVHGHCPTGADLHADRVAGWLRSKVERHPADWSRGRKAGPERNAAMVALGADLCLAFIGDCISPRCNKSGRHASHGATGCANLAENAGIPTRRIYADGGER